MWSIDWGLLVRLGNMVWRFLDRLSRVDPYDPYMWPDTVVVGSAVVVLLLAMTVALVLFRWRWWILAGAAGVAAAMLDWPQLELVSPPARRGTPPELLAVLVTLFLAAALWAFWYWMGQKWRDETRDRVMEGLLSIGPAAWLAVGAVFLVLLGLLTAPVDSRIRLVVGVMVITILAIIGVIAFLASTVRGSLPARPLLPDEEVPEE